MLYHIDWLVFGVGIFACWFLAKRLWIRWNYFIVCAGIPGDSTRLAHLGQLFHLVDIEQRLAGPDGWHRRALPLHTVRLEAMFELLFTVLLSSRWGTFSDQGSEVVCTKGRWTICFTLELHLFLRLLIATRSVWKSQVRCSGCCTRLVLQGSDRNDAICLSVLGCWRNKRFTGFECTDGFLGRRSFVFLFYQTGKLFVAFRWTLLVCWYSTRVVANLRLAQSVIRDSVRLGGPSDRCCRLRRLARKIILNWVGTIVWMQVRLAIDLLFEDLLATPMTFYPRSSDVLGRLKIEECPVQGLSDWFLFLLYQKVV